MSVILTGMDMPENCKECELRYLDTGDDAYFGSNEERCVIDDSKIEENGRAYDCPLKSVDGLIEKIKDSSFKHYIELGEYIGEKTEQWELIRTDKLIEIIKEYCEMEEK